LEDSSFWPTQAKVSETLSEDNKIIIIIIITIIIIAGGGSKGRALI
jgi:hypothetical protein